MRVFVAVFPPNGIQDRLFALIERVRRPADGMSWVKRDNLHYTLRFLGELEAPRAVAVCRAGNEAVRGMAPFTARLGAAGAFPNFRQPRVLWIGMAEGGPELELMAASLDEALRREGFGGPERPFAPHLTLGRVRDPGAGSRAAEALREEGVEGSFSIGAMTVVQSKLHPRGSIYTPLAECTFRPTSPGTPPEEKA
ncbi:MAG TPA: RNA 2',3'-cyclic phosphodiesterase [Candidatus Eisenbacteria bacterium]|nr:RNA 2',3'-cyclic phosphodiesterase [Candidatus Eisenbacteria bacterium]